MSSVLKQSKRIRGCKSDDMYEDGEPDPTILLTFDTFQTPTGSEDPRPTTVARIVSAIPAISVIVDTVQTPSGSEGPKARTVTRIATLTPPSVSVLVDTCQTLQGSEGPKSTTVTRIATPTITIPVILDLSKSSHTFVIKIELSRGASSHLPSKRIKTKQSTEKNKQFPKQSRTRK